VNVGTGTDLSIIDLAKLVAKIVDYSGDIRKDTSRPDGTPRKLMDVSKINAMGWKAKISLEEGIRRVYEDYRMKLAVGS
jgi:GDP-L-fucose synthase